MHTNFSLKFKDQRPKFKIWTLAFAFSLIFGGWILDFGAKAAEPPRPQGITLSPASQQVSIAANQKQKTVKFTITNNKPSTQTLKISVADFNTLSETGGRFFVGTSPTKLQKKYGLAGWVNIRRPLLSIAPGKTVSLSINIQNLPNLSPGGHYGALMVTLDNGNSGAGEQNRVALSPIASSLLFINKVGGDTHKLKLMDVSTTQKLFSLPTAATLGFDNFGNTHLTPRGTVTITGPRDNLVSRGVINQDSNLILPGTSRAFAVRLSSAGPTFWPGKYELTANYRFDGYNRFRTYRQSFWVITPIFWAAAGGLVIILALAGYFGYKKWRPRRRSSNA